MDRIDLHVEVPRVAPDDLTAGRTAESSAAIRARVLQARRIQQARSGTAVTCNAAMTPRQLRRYCGLGEEGRTFLRQVMERLGLSARAHDRVLRLARTIADLEGAEAITTAHVAEAVQYRTFDRQLRMVG